MHEDKKKIKILAVEDDEKCLKLLAILLEDYGFTYDTAIDGLDAWEKIQKDDYDLIVSDWNMPNMDGNKLLKKVREYIKTKRTPFLMLTARADGDSISTAVKVGVTDYIVKP
jgi:two-component system chemotaxis response regulator CheY